MEIALITRMKTRSLEGDVLGSRQHDSTTKHIPLDG